MARKYRIELNDFDEILNDEKYLVDKNETNEIEKGKEKEKDNKSNRRIKFIDEYNEEDFEKTSKHNRSIKQKATVIIPVVLGIIFIVFVILSVIITASLNNGKIYAGVYFNNHSLYRMTKSEVKEYINEKYIEPFKNRELNITYKDHTINTTMYDFTITPDSDKIAEEAYNVGRKGNILTRLFKVMSLKSKPVKMQFKLDINNVKLQETADTLNEQIYENVENPSYTILTNSVTFKGGKNGISINKEKLESDIISAIADLLENKIEGNSANITAEIKTEHFTHLSENEIFDKIYVAPLDASYSRVSKTQVSISDSVTGKTIDKDALSALVQRINNGEHIIYEELPIVEAIPEVTTDMLQKTLLAYTIASASSKNTSDDDVTDITRMQEREINIQKTVDALNGLILFPGETFNFWNEIGDTSLDFVMAYDNTPAAIEKVLGGGTSQVASAIYLAAFSSDLNFTEHHNYPYTVNYGPLGLDAHVVKNTKNLIFTNNLEFPIKISVTYLNDTINVKILGTDTKSGKSIQPTVTSKPISYSTEYVQDPNVDEGTEILQQGGIVGYEVKIYKKRIVNGTELLSEYIETITYQARKEIIVKGTKPIIME